MLDSPSVTNKEEESMLEVAQMAVPTLVGGLITVTTGNALVGAGAMVATNRLLHTGVAKTVARHVRKRLELFSEAMQRALPQRFTPEEDSEHYDQSIFQGYRYAMDAITSTVVPALGRLTAQYYDRHIDGFFRGVGRVLEDLTHEEFEGLRQIVSAAVYTKESIVELTPWTTPAGDLEARYSRPHQKGKERPVWGTTSPPGFQRTLQLLEQNGLTAPRAPTGTDLAMTGSYKLERELLERLEQILERTDVEPFEAKFERPPRA